MELTNRELLLAKAETTYGTDPTPTAAANNIGVLKESVTIEPGGELIPRDVLEASGSKLAGRVVRKVTSIKFRTELRGNRTTGAVADISAGLVANLLEIDPLLQACDLVPAYTAESGAGIRDGYVIYTPTRPTANGTGVTIYYHTEAKKYVLTGCKGNIENISIEAGKPGFIDWSFTGFYTAPADVAISGLTPAFQTTPPPILAGVAAHTNVDVVGNVDDTITKATHGLFNGDRVKFGGTPPAPLVAGTWYYVVNSLANTFKVAATLGGGVINLSDAGTSVKMWSAPAMLFGTWTGAVFSRADIKLGNAVNVRDDGNSLVGINGWIITDRDTTMDVDPESVAEATHPMWSDWAAQTAKDFRLTVGTDSGNRCVISAKARLVKVSYADRNNRRIQQASLRCAIETLGDGYGSDFKLMFQ